MPRQVDLHEIAHQERNAQSRFTTRVKICNSTGCLSAGGQAARAALEQAVRDDGAAERTEVVPTGCMGLCSRGPLVRVEPRPGTPRRYERVTADVAPAVATAAPAADAHQLDDDLPFFTRQHRVVLANAGRIDPDRIETYIAEGGYSAVETSLRDRTPDDVLEQVRASGLRGRGGAGYPTGKKWRMLAEAPGAHKYVVANGDEGDPGAYMDRTVMEDDPHRVIEGLILAAYAVGADHGYIYVRAEYPLALSRLERAIKAARRHGLLGRNILGSGFGLSLEVRLGAGAFVCGEETALMASVEGRRGLPRLRPPYPVERGLWGAPTMINNVETLANIPAIVRNGAEWFRAIGTPDSPGTKVFALAGALVNTGLIEVPMGITLREIIEDLGGGVPDGRSFKAAQTGGPSGGCIPATHADTPVDYEHLRELGSIMGSGGLIVMDDQVSMPSIARFFMEFCRQESCGKCVPCRVGTVQLHELLVRICAGAGTRADLDRLEQLSRTVRDTSLCGLGQTAPNPVFSTLEYFRDEYEALVDAADDGVRREPTGVGAATTTGAADGSTT